MSEPLYTIAELRAVEAAAQAALPAGELMQRAGAAAAVGIAAALPPGARVLVACGPGNNGGDGYVCALELAKRGFEVVCVVLGAPAAIDAIAAQHSWRDSGGTTLAALPEPAQYDALVDAMFGIGMARPLAGIHLDVAARFNRSLLPVFALDLPSGLDADRGAWVGGVPGVQATTTISFIGGKPGLYTGNGCDAAGEVHICPIGVAPGRHGGVLLAPDAFDDVLLPRRRNTHKGSYGSLAVVGGNAGMVGAPLLAARAALRLGAGRVYVNCIGAPELRFDPMQPELMFRPLAALTDISACVVGCGLGADGKARAALEAALRGDWPLVIDADALNLLAGDAALAACCRGRGAATVLTPHPLEAARLLACGAADVQQDRIGSARQLSAKLEATVVLKGAGTVIAQADRYAISPTGGPALATAGTGDVLAGMLGALLAQGFEPQQAIGGAVWMHGAAADEFGADIGLVAGDVAALAAQILGRLRARR